MGTVKSAWLGVKNQTGEPVGIQILLTQDSGADNNWTVSTVTFAALARTGTSTTTSLGKIERKPSNYKQPAVNVTATSLGEATVIKATHGGVCTPSPITFSELLAHAYTDIATILPREQRLRRSR